MTTTSANSPYLLNGYNPVSYSQLMKITNDPSSAPLVQLVELFHKTCNLVDVYMAIYNIVMFMFVSLRCKPVIMVCRVESSRSRFFNPHELLLFAKALETGQDDIVTIKLIFTDERIKYKNIHLAIYMHKQALNMWVHHV